MARRSRGGTSPFAWSTVFYLLLVFIAPLAFLGTASAQDDQAPLQEPMGNGTPLMQVFACDRIELIRMPQLLVSILEQLTRMLVLCGQPVRSDVLTLRL